MCMSKASGRLVRTVRGTSVPYVTEVQTDWLFLGGGGISARTALELLELSSGLRTIARWRSAAVRTDQPNPWNDLGSAVTATGSPAIAALDLSTNSDVWIRFGVGGNTTGTGPDGTVSFQHSLFTRAEGSNDPCGDVFGPSC